MMFEKIIGRFSEIITNLRWHKEKGTINAGRIAEYEALQTINAKIKDSGWKVYHSVRVPDKKTKSRREIDFILVSGSEVILIELKNWSGKLEIYKNDFIQVCKYNNEKRNHGNVLIDLNNKTKTLQKYLKETSGFDKNIKKYLVFYNNNLTLSSDLSLSENIIRYDQLKYFLPDRNIDSNTIIEALLKFFGLNMESKIDVKMMFAEKIEAARKSLNALGTWDKIDLFGNKILYGDVLTKGDKSIILNGRMITDRKAIDSIDFKIDRNIIKALFRDPKYSIKINYRNGKNYSTKINVENCLYFQSAGNKDIERIKFRHIKRLEYGYIEKFNFDVDWSNLSLNKTYQGKVIKLQESYMLIDIGAPIWGLLHNSKIKKGTLLSQFDIGDVILTKILYMNQRKRRISLEMV